MSWTVVKLVAAVAAVLGLTAIGLLGWLLLAGDGPDEPVAQESGALEAGAGDFLYAEPASADEVRDLADEVPVYWAGEVPGAEIELSRPAPDRVFVRYLTGGAEAGDPRPIFLTVGTYEVEDAAARLRRQAERGAGHLQRDLARDLVIYWSDESPSSAFLAEAGGDLQVEVYAPEPGRSLQLARAGAIIAVE